MKESQIAEEHRRILVDEYCRNVGNTKIMCDDCKFVEDCVDYGWEDCKKFTPAPSEPMTNEEYIKSLNTEQLAEWLANTFDLCGAGCSKCFVKELCFDEHNNKMPNDLMFEWLKKPHKE